MLKRQEQAKDITMCCCLHLPLQHCAEHGNISVLETLSEHGGTVSCTVEEKMG